MKHAAQQKYLEARKLYDAIYAEHRAENDRRDEEMRQLGYDPWEDTGVSVTERFPEDHPIWITGQEILDRLTPARKEMYDAARELFEWGVDRIVKQARASPAQKESFRDMLETVKQQSHVEDGFQRLEQICLELP